MEHDRKSFIFQLITADNMPLAVAGLTTSAQEDICRDMKRQLSGQSFGSCRTEYAVDCRLQDMIQQALPESGQQDSLYLSASIAVPGVTARTGAVLGVPGSRAESSADGIIVSGPYLQGFRPGRTAFCIYCPDEQSEARIRKCFATVTTGSRKQLIALYESLLASRRAFIMTADGSGPGACGMIGTDQDLIWLAELSLPDKKQNLAGLKRIGVLGGTFDPVHNGHLLAAETAREILQLDHVIFIPTGHTTYRDQHSVTRADWRCRMLQLALSERSDMSVSEYEARKMEGIAYTADTIEAVRNLCDTDAQLYFILGADSIRSLRYWKDFYRLSRLCRFIFINRSGWPLDELQDDLKRLRTDGVRFTVLTQMQMDISSTQIRKKAGTGKSIRYLVPPGVEEFIRLHRLYRQKEIPAAEGLVRKLSQLVPAAELSPRQRLQIFKKCLDQYYGNFMITDNTGHMLYVNQTMLRMYHLSEKAALAMTVRDLVQEGIIDHSVVQDVLDTGHESLGKLVIHGSRTEIDCMAKPILDKNGRVQYVTAFSHERSFMKQFDHKLAKEKEKRRAIKDTLIFLQKANARENKIICADARMQALYQNLEKLAASDSTIILYGESGVGKDVVANFIYNHSQRRDEIFMPVNCGAIPGDLMESEFFGYEKGAFTGADNRGRKGIFEMSHHGTVFLDEIGEMPLPLQMKLLRFLDSGEIKRVGSNQITYSDVRLIAATNKNLKQMVQEGRFREDLYYRLNTIPFYIPPLRERKADIEALAGYFLQEYNKKYLSECQFTDVDRQRLLAYNWPGNIRELRSAVERFVLTKGHIEILGTFHNPGQTMSELPGISGCTYDIPLRKARDAFEKEYIRHVLELCDWKVQKAAQHLGIHRSVLYGKIEKYEIEKK